MDGVNGKVFINPDPDSKEVDEFLLKRKDYNFYQEKFGKIDGKNHIIQGR